MRRAPGLSEAERQALLERIEDLLGDTPKGRLVKQVVEDLPADGPEPPAVPEAD
jgi:hypothetical protein